MLRYQPFGAARYETFGAPGAGSTGTLIISGGINTKGTPVSLGQTTFTWQHISVQIHSHADVGDQTVDIMVDDGSSNRFVLIEDLRLYTKSDDQGHLACSLPVYVPSGARLYARSAASTAGAFCWVSITGGSVGLGGTPGFARCRAFFTPSSQRGVLIDAGGSANTRSGWTEITSSTSSRAGALFAMVGGGADNARALANFLFDIGFGTSSAEAVLVPDIPMGQSAALDVPLPARFGPYPCDIKAGTRLVARAQCDIITAGDRTFDLALYGLVP